MIYYREGKTKWIRVNISLEKIIYKGGFNQIFKEGIIPMLQKIFWKIDKGALPNLFYWAGYLQTLTKVVIVKKITINYVNIVVKNTL